MAIEAVSTVSSSAGLASSRATIAENFDTFLSILTTQLKHQNPLEPLDTNEFTSQLVQFTNVEQQLKTNEFLEALITANLAVSQTQATSFIGRTITASNAMTELKGGQAVWHFSIPADASNTAVQIRNAAGELVFSDKMALTKGEHSFVWDGLDKAGEPLPEGSYSITIDARDTKGRAVTASTSTSGTVAGVDFTGDEPVLLVDGARIRLSSVLSVSSS